MTRSHLARFIVLGSALALGAGWSCNSLLGIETTRLEEPAKAFVPRLCKANESKIPQGADKASITISFMDFLTKKASPGISVSVCNSTNEPDCTDETFAGCALSSNAGGPAEDGGNVDNGGLAAVDVPLTPSKDDPAKNTWEKAFLLVAAPEYETFFYFFPHPITKDTNPYPIDGFLALRTVDWKTAIQGGVLVGSNAPKAPLDAARGQATINVFADAARKARRSNAILELYPAGSNTPVKDDKITVFYLADSLPSVNATQTDKFGFGGFLNVQPGMYTVGVRDASSDVIDGKITFFVVGGTWSTMDLTPNQIQMDSGVPDATDDVVEAGEDVDAGGDVNAAEDVVEEEAGEKDAGTGDSSAPESGTEE